MVVLLLLTFVLNSTAVVLRYQHGFTFEEMAVICNEKPGTLQARVSRALPLLRACVERTGGRL